MGRSFKMSTTGAVVAALAFAAHASAKEHAVQTKAFVGTYDVDTDIQRLTWSTYVDKTPAEIDAAMRQWKKAVALVDEIETFKVQKSAERNATLFFVRKAPFFMPNFEMVIATNATFDHESNRGRCEWKQVSGTAKQLSRTWTYVPEGDGSRVTFVNVLQMPFSPPKFLLGNIQEELGKSLDAFRKHVGATKALAKAPASP